MMHRRRFLQVASGCGAVALLGIGRAVQVGLLPRSREPYEAWSDLPPARGLRAIVAAGVLAANPHDSQPWKFRLAEGFIDLHLDVSRALGSVDQNRETCLAPSS